MRTIKKYPNRRLYDTEDSKYITLEDISVLVFENKEFVVVDAKTENDLTRNTLLQIIIEKEQSSIPIFSTAVLTQIIRSYKNQLQQRIRNQFFNSFFQFIADMLLKLIFIGTNNLSQCFSRKNRYATLFFFNNNL